MKSEQIIVKNEKGYSINTTNYKPNVPIEQSKKEMEDIIFNYRMFISELQGMSKNAFSKDKDFIVEKCEDVINWVVALNKIHYELVDLIYKIIEERDVITETLMEDIMALVKKIEQND